MSYAVAQLDTGFHVHIVETMEEIQVYPPTPAGKKDAEAHADRMNAPVRSTLSKAEKAFMDNVAKHGHPMDDPEKGIVGIGKSIALPGDDLLGDFAPELAAEAGTPIAADGPDPVLVATITAAVLAALEKKNA